MATCIACGADNRPGARFCQTCGARLGSPVESSGEPESSMAEHAASEARPFAQGVRLAVGFRSAKGAARAVNQDSLLALTLAPVYEGRAATALGLFAMADGLGGHQAGELASRLAVQALAQTVVSRVLLAELGGETCLAETLAAVMSEGFENANARMHAAAQAGGSDLGSTLTAALVRDDLAVIAHVGDSRAYHWRAGALRRLTTDHSVVERLVAAGQIAPEEAAGHPQKGVLYRSLGDKPAVEADVSDLRLSPGDRLLLCSDGVWESLGDKELDKAIAMQNDPQCVCDEVVRRALEATVADNVSVVVLGV